MTTKVWAEMAMDAAEDGMQNIPPAIYEWAAGAAEWRDLATADTVRELVYETGNRVVESLGSVTIPDHLPLVESQCALELMAELFDIGTETHGREVLLLRPIAARSLAHEQFEDVERQERWRAYESAHMLDAIGMLLFMAFAIWGTF